MLYMRFGTAIYINIFSDDSTTTPASYKYKAFRGDQFEPVEKQSELILIKKCGGGGARGGSNIAAKRTDHVCRRSGANSSFDVWKLMLPQGAFRRKRLINYEELMSDRVRYCDACATRIM